MPSDTTSSPATRSGKETPIGREAPTDFIRAIIREDVKAGKNGGRVWTRFPPEPNGYLHIGHAKSICLNFGVSEEFGGRCNLRFDDTDPAKEDTTFVEAIKHDVRWLGFSWGDGLFNASDYFAELYRLAIQLIERGKAYVCSLNEEDIRRHRGTVTEPGRESPYRSRPIAENLDLFRRMRAGEFPDGEHVLRAKIDMASPNMKMRDPVIYRVRHVRHHRTGDEWPIYPMYDFAHPLSDALEGITHSLCTLEFENNREFYDWILEQVDVPSQPRQIEFARLNLNYTVMSKRKLLQLVKEKHVRGWDDPRMPTLAGLRRRGYTPEAIRDFCRSVGIAKSDNVVDIGQLEYFIRSDLNQKAPRTLCVLRPLKIVIENYPEGKTEELEAPYYPHDVPKEGTRTVPFSREIYIEKDDFLEDPPRKYYRLAPGREVRLRYAYIIRCERVLKDPKTGEVTELRATYDPASKSGADTSGKKVQGTIHWVSAEHARSAEIRLYDRLFSVENPDADGDKDFRSYLNPESLVTHHGLVEPSLADATPGARYQFERQGYFYADPDSKPDRLVFNRIVTLRDSWAKLSQPAEATQKRRRSRRQSESPQTVRGRKPEDARAATPAVKLTDGQQEKMATYEKTLGLPRQDVLLLVSDRDLDAFFEKTIRLHPKPKSVANWIVNELRPELKDSPIGSLPFGAKEVAELLAMVDDGVVSRTGAREVFTAMMAKGGAPKEIVERRGLQQLTDRSTLEPIIDDVIAAHPENAERYRQGKTNLLGFFVKEVLSATSGKANPRLVSELLRSKLS